MPSRPLPTPPPLPAAALVPGPLLLLVLGLPLLIGCSLYLALLATTHSLADILRLNQIAFYQGTAFSLRVSFTAGQLWAARALTIGLVGSLSGSLLYLLRRCPAARAELRQLWAETRGAARRLPGSWGGLTGAQQWTVGGLFGLLSAVRLYYLVTYPLFFDETTSFNYFVREGWLAVSSYYPLPNNHLLTNTLAWLFYQLHPTIYGAMRLPTFLLSSLCTALVYLALLRTTNFTVATVAVGLFCLTPYSLAHAFEGRGYFLANACVGIGFVAALEIMQPTRYVRLGWALLVLSSLASLYAVPSFLYAYLSLTTVLLITFLARRQGAAVARLVQSGVLVGAGCLLLYAPVLAVSGARALFANQYVAPLAGPVYWARFLPYIRYATGVNVGQERLGLWLDVALLAGLGWLTLTSRARLVRTVGWPALGCAFLPFCWLMLQQVQPPSRTFYFQLLLLFVVAGILLEHLLRRWQVGRYRQLGLLSGLLLAYGAYQMHYFNQRRVPLQRANDQAYQAYRQLVRHRARHVLVLSDDYEYLYYYLHQGSYSFTMTSGEAKPRPKLPYDYVLLPPATTHPQDSSRVLPYYRY